MSKHLCDICKISFNTGEGLIQHKKRGFYKNNFDELILKNKKKYFLFSKNKQITRKHEESYNISYIYFHSIDGNVDGHVLKKSGTIMTSGVINKNIKNGCMKQLKGKEYNNILNFFDE